MAQTNKSKTTKTKNDRLQIRVDSNTLSLIERAAYFSHKSVSDFVTDQAVSAANKVIAEHQKITLPDEDWDIFFHALLNPPKPNRALKTAFARYKQKQSGKI